ncbi:MAG TPA: hypothetical protein VGP17_07715 [Solirubrobacteraceae bacterium]|jgi:hypothetical protein|nr:hypothetical protein [Solirubrobacteraceae bacterium]
MTQSSSRWGHLDLASLAVLVVMVAALAFVVAPSSAYATTYYYEPLYCSQQLPPDGTCPPNGEQWYMHLIKNEGNADKEAHAVCIDAYLTGPGKYTEQKCEYYGEKNAFQAYSEEYGYPRAWNAGEITHFVKGWAYGWCEKEYC